MTCDGAYIPIEHYVEMMLSQLRTVVEQEETVTMERTLDKCCPDGAEYKAPGETDNSIILYLLTFVSYVLIKECAVYPTLPKWLLLHCQLRRKENIKRLQSVLKYCLQDFHGVLTKIPVLTTCKVRDVADGKAGYCQLGHSHWFRALNPFLFLQIPKR